LSRVGTLFEYANRNGLYEAVNPATGMNPKERRSAHEKRAPFAQEELIKLFHSEEYLEDKHKQPFQ
jgi:hypothetical protein